MGASDAADLVARSTAACEVPPKVADPLVLARVAVLLLARPSAPLPRPSRRCAA